MSFETGTQIKFTSGTYQGLTGTILRIKGAKTCDVLLDGNKFTVTGKVAQMEKA